MTAVRVVGIGASAGGLEAIKLLLAHTPDDTGLAFVVLQHLAPTQTGMLRAALADSTKLPIVDLASGTRLAPNTLFLVPPNTGVAVVGDAFVTREAPTGGRSRNPIDSLLVSLAEAFGARSIGVILSGTASDGMDGLRAMRNAGGATFVQDPATAQFDEMPRNAIAIGAATAVLSPELIGIELGKLRGDGRSAGDVPAPAAKILAHLRDATGVDFTNYKRATIDRRINRRMTEHGIATVDAYAAFLATHAAEASALYEDLLIHVTEFFRDRDTLDELAIRVFPVVVDSMPPAESIRIWVPGCSSGQEVYSIAMLLVEFLEARGLHRQIQIFGTDLSERSVDAARQAEYPETIEAEVGAARLARFFTRTETGWRVNKAIRERCVFVRHDVTADPPFSKLDLISCRNVLIYLGTPLQQGVIPMLHYALNQPGFLLIGRAESLGGFDALFAPLASGLPIYARQPTAARSALTLGLGRRGRDPFDADTKRARSALDVQRDVDHVLLARYAPACVLVDGNAEILQFRGRTGAFLEPTPGQPTHNLIKMMRGGLGAELRLVLQRAQRSDAAVRQAGVILREDGNQRAVDLTVVPIPGLSAADRHFIVIFEEAGVRSAPAHATELRVAPAARDEVAALEQELLATKEYLHSALAQNSITVEELGAANEELQSMNEELLSMNEELQTAKEELQSTNEELETVNEELHRGNEQLHVLNDDLVNLLAAVDIAIAIVDTAQLVRRFTPRARALLNLLPADVGRKITELQPNVGIPGLGATIAEVIATLEMREAEVVDADGHAYRMQVRPYRSSGDAVSGAVISFVDISVLRRAVDEARLARDYAARLAVVEREALEATARERDAFLNAVSHELRGPLNAIMLWTSLLRRGELDVGQRARGLATIEQSARAEAQLVDDLLELAASRSPQRSLAIAPEAIDPVPSVEAALDAVRADAQAKQVTLVCELAPRLRARVDPRRLQQMAWHLVSNAVKFTPSGGSVTISLASWGAGVELAVSDTGQGITAELLPHVFEPFRRADTSTARAHQGLGIGLSLVRHLAERHGGSISVHSDGLGQGARFTLALPPAP